MSETRDPKHEAEREELAAEAARFVTTIGLYLSPQGTKDLQATVRAFVRKAFDAGRAAGAEEERAAVVGWLRDGNGTQVDTWVLGDHGIDTPETVYALGDAIEQGAHRKAGKP